MAVVNHVSLPLAAVIRVSSLAGRDKDSDRFHSAREQERVCRGEAERLGVPIVVLPVELDVSGGRAIDDRPSLRAAIEGVEAGIYSGVIGAYLSRLTRRRGDELWQRVEAAGGRVISVREQLDTRTVAGRMMRDVQQAVDVAERERHAEQFELLRESSTAAGIWQRRQTPLGYARDPDTRRLIIVEEQAQRVQEAFARRAAGSSLVQVADVLKMTPAGTRYLLKNRVYLGELSVGVHVNPAAHPPIVDVETFDAAQMTRPRAARRFKEPALLAGLARCSGCGYVMTRSGGGKGSRPATYVCTVRHTEGRCPAPAVVTARLLDEHVEGIALEALRKWKVSARKGDQAQALRREVQDAEEELGAFLEATSARDLGVELFARQVGRRRDDLERARRGLAAAEPAGSVGVPERVLEAWEVMSETERGHVLRGLLEVVVVARAGGRGVGARVPLAGRVRVLQYGAGVLPAEGFVPLPLGDLNGPDVLGPAGG